MTSQFSARYRKVIQDRTQCKSYIIQDSTSISGEVIPQCIDITNDTKQLLGDGSYSGTKTKVNNIANLVRHSQNNGKIVYGDNGLSSPFLDPETTEDTAVSNYYRNCSLKSLPIINGLRGGIVPVKMRTNKF